MKSSTRRILQLLHVVSWIIFIGLCFKTGTLIFSAFASLFVNPEAIRKLYMELNLSSLLQYDKRDFINVMSLIIFISGLKAYMFYMVIRIFLTMNITNPFSETVSLLISSISYIALGIGVITIIANGYVEWLAKRGVGFPDMTHFTGGSSEFLMLSAVIFIIAQVYKRGIEIQSENELTV